MQPARKEEKDNAGMRLRMSAGSRRRNISNRARPGLPIEAWPSRRGQSEPCSRPGHALANISRRPSPEHLAIDLLLRFLLLILQFLEPGLALKQVGVLGVHLQRGLDVLHGLVDVPELLPDIRSSEAGLDALPDVQAVVEARLGLLVVRLGRVLVLVALDLGRSLRVAQRHVQIAARLDLVGLLLLLRAHVLGHLWPADVVHRLLVPPDGVVELPGLE
mmetsp:Transcript_23838/g.62194  ORF Transcript_23838/g.62194 Transcript_23838/m.62194 type:complete len:218 (+) Transcript_23838:109-762(+)